MEKDKKRYCTVCGRELLSAATRLVQQHYFIRPYRRYKNVEVWDLCIECYKDILLTIKERKKNED